MTRRGPRQRRDPGWRPRRRRPDGADLSSLGPPRPEAAGALPETPAVVAEPVGGSETGGSSPRGRAPGAGVALFSGRVATMFTSRVMVAGIAIVNSFLLARLIGPAGKGDFYLIAMIP